LKKLNVNNPIKSLNYFTYPFWVKNKINVFSYIHDSNKDSLPPSVWRKKALEIIYKYKQEKYDIFYTDGSKKENLASLAVTDEEKALKVLKLSETTSIYTAELKAIIVAAHLAKPSSKVAIFTDSLSAVRALQKRDERDRRTVWSMNEIQKSPAKKIDIIWIPSHQGIRGNETADLHAKLNLKTPITNNEQHAEDLISYFKKSIWKNKQEWWEKQNTKLNEIKTTFTKEEVPKNFTRTDLKVWTRLRIGHTQITHENIYHRQYSKVCDCKDTEITVKHILLECEKYKIQRKKYEITLENLKDTNKFEKLKLYLKEINILSKI
jgi:ribonuclease HI